MQTKTKIACVKITGQSVSFQEKSLIKMPYPKPLSVGVIRSIEDAKYVPESENTKGYLLYNAGNKITVDAINSHFLYFILGKVTLLF
jgi:hypothetical protein